MKIISIYPNFANRGGAQDVVIQLAKALNNEKEPPIVMTSTPREQIYSEYIDGVVFIPFLFKNILKLKRKDTIFISHHRKTTSLLVLISKVVPGIKILHVAHNTFNNLRTFTFLPKRIIAVSNGVKENLVDYFNVPEKNVTVIHNGIKDVRKCNVPQFCTLTETKGEIVNILVAGRICDEKQQVEIVKRTKNQLSNNIRFYFIGVGNDAEKLQNEIGHSEQYFYLGYKNVSDIIAEFDYVCLFSKKEGLGLTLIEGCAAGKPLITNDIPAVLDINENEKTGYVFHDFDALIKGINCLPFRDSVKYKILSENARKKYENNFTETVMIRNYEKYLSRCFTVE